MGNQADFDVAIIGGGPAGSASASYLARAGLKCAIFERELFPREHVGESLVPSTTMVFEELGFLPTMEEAGFVHKFGAAWTVKEDRRAFDVTWEGLTPSTHVDLRFQERKQAGVNQDYTYHVDRGKFDLLLLQHANKLGAAVYEGIHVQRVDLDEDPNPRVRFKLGRKDCDVTARIVIDASGRRTMLGGQLGLRVKDPVFDQFALHTWFDGYERGSGQQNDFIFIHFLPLTNTWVWQIPITETVTSIGVVTQKKNFDKSRTSREKFFWDCLATRPELHDRLKAATQMRPLKEEADYSYGMKQICGDRFVLVGDAARFVDPIFSSGVSIALQSARLASKDILKAADNGGFKREAFANFEKLMRNGVKHWYEFITLYYRLNAVFTAFIVDPRYRIEVLRLLQGDVYTDMEPMALTKMREVVTAVEANPDHIWHGLLGDLSVEASKPTY